MFQQDFIMKQIQMFTQVLQQVLFNKQAGNQQEARQLVKETLNELTEDHPDSFHDLSLKETLNLFRNEGKFNSELALVVAELLIEEGELLAENEAEKRYLQALLLYQKALDDPDIAVPLQSGQIIGQLKEKLNGSPGLNEISDLMIYE